MIMTGNPIVDAVTKINITGNVIPRTWRKTITKENGKPYPLAREILADIVYWYRASEVVDPVSREVSYKKKFQHEMLYKPYSQFEEEYGESKKTIREALRRLEEIGVIKKHLMTVRTNGMTLNNVLFIEIIPKILLSLTYPKEDISDKTISNPTEFVNNENKIFVESVEEKQKKDTIIEKNTAETQATGSSISGSAVSEEAINEKTVSPVAVTENPLSTDASGKATTKNINNTGEKQTVYFTDGDIKITEKVHIESISDEELFDFENIKELKNTAETSHSSYPSTQKGNTLLPKRERHTKSTTKNIYNIFNNQSNQSNVSIDDRETTPKNGLMDRTEYKKCVENAYEEYNFAKIKELLDITNEEKVKSACEVEKVDIEKFNDLLLILYDAFNTSKPYLQISGEKKPKEVVIAKLSKLSATEIAYALRKYGEQTTKIKNPTAYLLTLLYKAKEQRKFEIENQTNHEERKNKPTKSCTPKKKNQFQQFPQREYTSQQFRDLERKLLKQE